MSPAAEPLAPGARRVRAALGLAAGLLLLAAPGDPDPPRPCPAPSEVSARAGHTRSVRCDGAPGARLRGPARRLFGLPLDPNAADARTLESLPGIGPVRAAAIVRGRPFASLAELRRVPGIGPRTLERVAPLLAVGPGPEARP